MGKKTSAVYKTLVEGATSGLRDEALYGYVLRHHPKLTFTRFMRSSIKALKDPDLTDRNILTVIAALAITHKIQDQRKTPRL